MKHLRARGALVLGCALGLAIGWMDTRPRWDDTGITVAALLAAGAVTGFLDPRRPWLAALTVGAGVPLLTFATGGSAGALVAFLPALLGALAGAATGVSRNTPAHG